MHLQIVTICSSSHKFFSVLKVTITSAPRGCTRDEGGPLGVGLQEQAPNRLKLLWSKAMVVSVEEKVPL
jgi:hypothetical protein